MPKGMHLPCLMENEIVAMFYHCLKNVDKSAIDFGEVAKALGEKSAGKAKERMIRMMRAQEKGAPGGPRVTSGNPETAKKVNTLGNRGRKRKAAAVEETKVNEDGEDRSSIGGDWKDTEPEDAGGSYGLVKPIKAEGNAGGADEDGIDGSKTA